MTDLDWGMVDEDAETGEPVPCVVCGMNSQRGGTGCCSQQCLDALHEAYPTTREYLLAVLWKALETARDDAFGVYLDNRSTPGRYDTVVIDGDLNLEAIADAIMAELGNGRIS